jgi:hypothetical protein
MVLFMRIAVFNADATRASAHALSASPDNPIA